MDKHNYLYIHNVYSYKSSLILFKLKNNLSNDLGRLGLSMAGCKARDRFVLSLCKNQNIPVQVSMGGGYSVHLKNIIDAHSNTFELAQELFF